jgi:outer membrane receptor protein involved in Fe transport
MLAIVTAMLSASKVQAQSQQGLPANEQVSPQEQQTTAPTPSQPATSAPEPAAVPSKQQGAAPRAGSDTHLPQILVHGAKNKPASKPVAVIKRAPEAAPVDATTAAQAALDAKTQEFNNARDNNLLTKLGASTTSISRAAIERTPQADNQPIDKLILQFPGVSYDSAISNPNFHIRGEYANAQIRINGIVVPEGVSALGPFLDTNFIGNISLLTGSLPAEYGLRTAGVLDITSRSFATPGGEVSFYGGSRQTFTPSIDYGGSFGNSEYFVSARGNWNGLGLESATPTLNAIHDFTQQGKFFGYASSMLDDSTRLSVISAASYSQFQIPNQPGQQPMGDFPTNPTNLDSTQINENEIDQYYLTMATLQKHGTDGDAQFAVYSRYAQVHFLPDVFNDLAFNDQASNIIRQSTMTGTQFDTSYILNDRHTLRAGFAVSGEQTNVTNVATVLPGSPGAVTGGPFNITDQTSLLGWNLGTYVQDEWKISNTLTINAGVRFDQLYQFVDTNQFSPRIALVYKPLDGTTIHAGYSRYFTPPYQAQATQANFTLFNGTTVEPDIQQADPVKPERSNYFDVGVDQVVAPGLAMGIDLYYKRAKDMLDDGQFGNVPILTQFNWADGYSEGGEFKINYTQGNFNAYANFAYNISRATGPESNQYLFDADEFAYLQTHWHYTDDMQRMTGSAGASYRFMNATTVSANLIYGSGLRSGDFPEVAPNDTHATPYVSVNTGIAHDVRWSTDYKPLTVRFDVVNLFDRIYQLRTGDGIGEFAPQYGARRGYYFGLSQKL